MVEKKIEVTKIYEIIDSIHNWDSGCPFKLQLKKKLSNYVG